MTDPAQPRLTRAEAERLLADCPLHAAIGLELAGWDGSGVRFDFRPPALVRAADQGGVHGGALATALDTAACFAVIVTIGQDCSTVDLRTDFLRPAIDSTFTVVGELGRAGQRFAWADATLCTTEGRMIARARGVFTW